MPVASPVCWALAALVLLAGASRQESSRAAGAEPAELSVADFGATPNDGENDAPGLRAALEACRRRGPTTLVLPPGRYDLRDEEAVRLMDDPVSALDAPVRHALQDDLLRWHSTFEGTTLHVTHDGQEAMRMADKIAVLEEGRIVQFATPVEIYQQPATRSVARAIGWPPINLLSGATLSNDSVVANFHWDQKLNVEVGVRAEAFSLLEATAEPADWHGLGVLGVVTRVTWIDGR